MISAERLSLHPVEQEHEAFIVNYLADKEHARYLPLERPYTEDEALLWFNGRVAHWLQHDFGTFIVTLKETKEAVGYCGIEYVRDTRFIDIRYGIAQRFWGRGFAYEAASAVLQNGFNTLGIEKLYGAAVPQNLTSLRVLEKLGMREDQEFNVYGKEIAHFSATVDRFNARAAGNV